MENEGNQRTAAQYDMAAAEAENELRLKIEGMTPDERKAVAQVSAWWKKNYWASGHKRLGRIIRDLRV